MIAAVSIWDLGFIFLCLFTLQKENKNPGNDLEELLIDISGILFKILLAI